jgi:enoyl-CoA hydratase
VSPDTALDQNGDTGDEEVLLETRVGRVAVLTLNRPQAANALSPALIRALNTALEAAELDDDVTAVVITGAGERAFCAGLHPKAFAEPAGGHELSEDSAPDMARRYGGAIRQDYPLPIVAAVNGTAVAGGFELLMGCDLVIAAEHAKFGVAEVKRGLIPGGGGTTLGARLPLAIALELVLRGDTVEAARAYEIGLVNRVVPGAEVLDAAVALASTIADNGPLAIRVAKRLVRSGVQAGIEASWPDGATLMEVFNSDDAKEGAIAFLERRPPRFTGQ